MAANMGRRVFVIGVGMTKFEKPGRSDDDYPEWAKIAATKALADAGIKYSEVQQAAVGYVYGDTCCGQRAIYELGMTEIPIFNVNNACATGSSAIVLGKSFIQGGQAECVMALGFEKMEKGSLKPKYLDRSSPMDHFVSVMSEMTDIEASPITAQLFGNAGREHMEKYGTKMSHFAKIAHKNHKHSVNNPYSQFRDEYSLEQIMKSPMIHDPMTKLQCCPTSDGAACAILASEDFVIKHNLQAQAVEIISQVMATDPPTSLDGKSHMRLVGYDMTKNSAKRLFDQAGLSPKDVQVVELHDCFSANELITYEALGLCAEGKAGEFIDRGDNTYGGQFVINPSGGLISKGHPLGATGLAQCSELCWQLRGLADKRQVKGAKVALQHNLGLGGAVVLTLYKLGFPEYARQGSMLQAVPTSAAAGDFKSKAIFDQIDAAMESMGAEYVKKIKGIFVFKVKDGNKEGTWVVDVKNGTGSVKFTNDEAKGDVTVSMQDADMVKLMMGQLNPQQAFFQGKLKIKGNMGMAMKLRELTNTGSKL